MSIDLQESDSASLDDCEFMVAKNEDSYYEDSSDCTSEESVVLEPASKLIIKVYLGA